MPRGRKRRTATQVANLIITRSVDSSNGCRVWTGPLTMDGYPRLTWKSDDGHLISGAHRLSYHLFVGPVPNDHRQAIDHLCRNRACVQPEHLEMVTGRENVMRSPIAIGALNAAKTHCPQGHPYDEANTYVWRHTRKSTTVRICRACNRERAQRRAARRRAVA